MDSYLLLWQTEPAVYRLAPHHPFFPVCRNLDKLCTSVGWTVYPAHKLQQHTQHAPGSGTLSAPTTLAYNYFRLRLNKSQLAKHSVRYGNNRRTTLRIRNIGSWHIIGVSSLNWRIEGDGWHKWGGCGNQGVEFGSKVFNPVSFNMLTSW